MEYAQRIGARIARLRTEKHLTQGQLAQAAGVPRDALARWEAGGGLPGRAELTALARPLGTTAAALLNADEDEPDEAPVGFLTFPRTEQAWRAQARCMRGSGPRTAYALAARARGLDVRVVHPSGICGPYDYGHGHLTQLVQDFCTGRLAAGVDGGYDFVDVRDVAAGILACCERGRPGECYILSGRYCTVRDVLAMLHRITGRRRVRVMLPLWLARAMAPLSEQYYRLLRQPPLYTAYSLYTLSSGARFSHAKAARELGYTTRPFGTTLADTVAWLRRQGRI